MLANHLLKDVSEDDLSKTCLQLITKTDFFDIYVENDEEKIQKTDYAIQIISEYLKGVAGKDGITGKQFRNKFNEIQAQLHEDISCADQHAAKCPFNLGKLFEILNATLLALHFR